ncbi:MAG TPA: response regulator transcription factor [Acidimicrobiales bacterium]|jgi:two-component system OmpR family response regulator|nr:response regulator transcription factor [Acidimicrobiales bacterium]
MTDEPRRVLFVEDDHDLASAVAGLLVDEGYVVDQAFDGDTGLEAALRGDYDVIVLDIMMPKRSGFRVCQELRAAGIQTPLLMLTAKEGEWDEVEGLDVGADDFLRKPFEKSVLMARLHALLRRQERGRPQPLSVGAVTLDPVTRHVSAYARTVTLTPREFSLLEYLMSHANTTLSKTEILSVVWGSDFDGDQNIVEVYVGYLRKKIDLADEPSVIRTVRGFGYSARDT